MKDNNKIEIQIKDGYIYYNGSYILTTYDTGIQRFDSNDNLRTVTGYYCRAYHSLEDVEADDYYDDFTIAYGWEIQGKNNSDIYNAIVDYLR